MSNRKTKNSEVVQPGEGVMDLLFKSTIVGESGRAYRLEVLYWFVRLVKKVHQDDPQICAIADHVLKISDKVEEGWINWGQIRDSCSRINNQICVYERQLRAARES